jgi:hypothetical protein
MIVKDALRLTGRQAGEQHPLTIPSLKKQPRADLLKAEQSVLAARLAWLPYNPLPILLSPHPDYLIQIISTSLCQQGWLFYQGLLVVYYFYEKQ